MLYALCVHYPALIITSSAHPAQVAQA